MKKIQVLGTGCAKCQKLAAVADEAAKARQYNLEFRVADATGNPYLVLAALVRAGLDGLRSGASLARHVPGALPVSLGEALAHLENAPDSWLGAGLKAGYVAFKRAEAAGLADLGFARSDRLIVVGDNRPRLYWAMCAGQSLGGVPVPVYQDSVTEELAYVVGHAGARFAIAENQEQVA